MKVLGYFIAGLFLAFILFGPAVGWYLVSKDTFSALTYEGSEEAVITDCTSIRNSGQRSSYRRVPVVILNSGKRVPGSVDEIRFLWECDDRVGDSVEVIYDLQNPERAKINTFLEMWFLPVVLGIVCLIWYAAIMIGYMNKYRSNAK